MSVYLGIDWSQASHEACFLNAHGAIIARSTIPHTPAGFLQLDVIRQHLGIAAADCWVGLETAHTLLIDWLWAHGYCQVYVIPPIAVREARKRHRQSGAYSDPFDAFAIADLLRTDQPRLQPWLPDSPLIQQLRAHVSFWLYLTHELTRTANRLRAVLERYYPAALHVFSTPLPRIALHLVLAYPTPQDAARLSWPDFVHFARCHHYRQTEQRLRASYARLQQPALVAAPAVVRAYHAEAMMLAQHQLQLMDHKEALGNVMHACFQHHPDAALFASLPGTGRFLAPALLAKVGDDRRRFPTAESLQALAGTCPVTERSGKRKKVIKFRLGCDREFRWIAQQWAIASLAKSAWAVGYWEEVRQRSRSHTRAYRCLANRWLAIVWKVWQSRQP